MKSISASDAPKARGLTAKKGKPDGGLAEATQVSEERQAKTERLKELRLAKEATLQADNDD